MSKLTGLTLKGAIEGLRAKASFSAVELTRQPTSKAVGGRRGALNAFVL